MSPYMNRTGDLISIHKNEMIPGIDFNLSLYGITIFAVYMSYII
jgi:hypothetical protein